MINMQHLMWKLSRALQMPKKRLFKKICGHKERYAICYRNMTNEQDTLFTAKCVEKFSTVFINDECWYADPILFEYKGRKYLFCEKYIERERRGELACSAIVDNTFSQPLTIISENFHMSFPMVFIWKEEIFMLPETSADGSIRLYKARKFPYEWSLIARFPTDLYVVDNIVISKEPNKIGILASDVNKNNELQARYIRYSIKLDNEIYSLIMDDDFNKNQIYDYSSRNAGQMIHYSNSNFIPIQESTKFDYGVSLSLTRMKHDDIQRRDVIFSKSINDVEVEGIDSKSYIGIHSYALDSELEIIDIRYLD